MAAYADPSHGSAAAPAQNKSTGITASVSVAAQTSSTSASVFVGASAEISRHAAKGKGALFSVEEKKECKAGLPPDGDLQPCSGSNQAQGAAPVAPGPGTVPQTVATVATTPVAQPPSHPAVLVKAALNPPNPSAAKPGPTFLHEPLQLATGGWSGVSLKTATDLRVPALFSAAVLLFVLLQALVDRRDPKMSRAPERGEDDTVGFC